MRKILALILSALMVMSVAACCVSVSAADGTPIKTAAEFAAMAADGNYYLDADIEINTPYEQKFTGVLDGNGHKVTVSCPMFKILDGAVKNLTVNGTITANDGLATAAIAVRTVNGMYAENVTTNVNITLTGDKRGMYAAGFLATDNFVEADNTEYYGGLQPQNNSKARSAFINCKNTGDITIIGTIPANNEKTSASTMKPRAAGIAAIVSGITCIECENTGDISIPLVDLIPVGDGTYTNNNITTSIAGGLVARVGLGAGCSFTSFYSCKNSGDITAYGDAAGIASYLGVDGNLTPYVFYGCVNSGKITSANQAGGIATYVYGQGTQYVDMEFCINTGDLYYGKNATYAYASPFIAYTNTKATTIEACISTGKIYEIGNGFANCAHSFIGVSSADPLSYFVYYNAIYDPDGHITQYSMCADSTTEKNYGNRHTLEEGLSSNSDAFTVLKTLDDVKSGKIAYELNTSFMEDNEGTLKDTAVWNAVMKDDGTYLYSGSYDYDYIWHQAIGVDDIPTVENKANTFIDYADGKYKNVAELKSEVETTVAATTAEVTTKQPEETAAPSDETTAAADDVATETATAETEAPKTDDKKSGCGSSAVSAAVILVAVLGTACVSKKH